MIILVFNRWWKRTNVTDPAQRQSQAIKDLKWYYARVFNGVSKH